MRCLADTSILAIRDSTEGNLLHVTAFGPYYGTKYQFGAGNLKCLDDLTEKYKIYRRYSLGYIRQTLEYVCRVLSPEWESKRMVQG